MMLHELLNDNLCSIFGTKNPNLKCIPIYGNSTLELN